MYTLWQLLLRKSAAMIFHLAGTGSLTFSTHKQSAVSTMIDAHYHLQLNHAN